MDAMGTVRTRANHFAVTLPNGDVSPFGGLPRRISVTTGKISVARNGLNNTASNLAYAAFLKVNNP
jgi:hypothetical protein